MKNTFQEFVPLTFSKAKDTNGHDVMEFEGIASTSSEDADGEFLDPTGFDSEYFLKSGYFNWNHMTNDDPTAVVGRPTKAELTSKNEYLLGGKLFAKSKKAQQIYQLQKALEAEGMQLGLSIEGKVLERDPSNAKIVRKARITGCAITPNPKNSDTTMRLLKGEQYSALLTDDLKKSISAYDNEDKDTKEKAMDTGSTKPLAKESLDKKLFDINSKKISKGTFFDYISRNLPKITLSKANLFFKKLQLREMDTSKNEINLDTLSKAINEMSLKETVVPVKEVVETANLDDSRVDALEKGFGEIKSILGDLVKAMPSMVSKKDPEKEEEDAKKKEAVEERKEDTVEKAITLSPNDDLIKSLGGIVKSEINDLKKSFTDKIEAVETKNAESLDEFKKSVSETLKNADLASDGNKSILTKSFVKQDGDDIQKSNGFRELNSVRDKREICDTLTKAVMADAGGVKAGEQEAANAIIAFESSNRVSKALISKAKELNITIV